MDITPFKFYSFRAASNFARVCSNPARPECPSGSNEIAFFCVSIAFAVSPVR